MNRLATSFLIAVLLLAAAPHSSAQTSQPAAKFVVGRNTTYVTGPVNSDGTINYVAAYNATLGPVPKAGDNAAIPLLIANATEVSWQFDKNAFEALEIPKPDPNVGIGSLFLFAKSISDSTPQADIDAMDAAIQKGPWKSADYPLAARWLKAKSKAFDLLDEAARRPAFYLPMVPNAAPPEFSKSLPSLSLFRNASGALVTRAMNRAGDGDIASALNDLQRARLLAHKGPSHGTIIDNLVLQAVDFLILRGYLGLLAAGVFTPDQLQQVKKTLDDYQIAPEFNYRTATGERFDTLDVIMRCIRGNAKEVFQNSYNLLSPNPAPIDLGNLEHVDWNIVLQETNRAFDNAAFTAGLPREERLAQLQAQKKAAADDKWPESGIFEGSDPDLSGVKPLEAFLKLRPNETPDAYSHRIGRWMGAPDATFDRRYLTLHARVIAARELALLQIALAEFHAAHGSYPDSLNALDAKPHLDPITEKPFGYRREKAGYALWSAGLNEHDDGGKEDDVVVSTEK